MILLKDVYQAKKQWDCGWFVAWSRLRARKEYWARRRPPTPGDIAGASERDAGSVEAGTPRASSHLR